MTDHERAAARFAADLELDEVPEAVLDHVGLVLADTVGAIVGGSTDEAVAALASRLAEASTGSASILGTHHRAAVGEAALVNGTAGTVLELDEGHKYAAGHPAIHVLPALLAEAEVDGGSMDRLSVSFVAAYEVVTRVAESCYPLADGYHPHGVWGGIGAAVAVCRYREFDADRLLTAMRIAANNAQHTQMAAAIEGATVRNTYSGMSNLTGKLAVDMAAAGFTGLEKGIERHLSSATADGVDPERLSEAVGERWEVTRGYFKRHAACRYTHPTLDAIAALQATEPIDPDRVTSVVVETYPTAASLNRAHPTNSLEAKFSVPFAVASRLVHGHSDKPAFESAAITDRVTSLADRVEVSSADDLAARVPDARSARVTIRFEDGRERSHEVEHAKGGAERPWSEAELREKFDTLVVPVLGPETAQDLWSTLRTRSTRPGRICELASNAG